VAPQLHYGAIYGELLKLTVEHMPNFMYRYVTALSKFTLCSFYGSFTEGTWNERTLGRSCLPACMCVCPSVSIFRLPDYWTTELLDNLILIQSIHLKSLIYIKLKLNFRFSEKEYECDFKFVKPSEHNGYYIYTVCFNI
jgi:hypothetical protein